MKKISALLLSLAMVLLLTTPASAAPLPVISYYGFQPDGTLYHYYSFGDELFYDVRYDGNDMCNGFRLVGLPAGTVSDGWLRETLSINGQYQCVNARYKLDTSMPEEYPAGNRNMLLEVTVEGQNGPALFDGDNDIITLYMKHGANLKAPETAVVVTSLGYQRFQGPVWWSLTNDVNEKEELRRLYESGLAGDALYDKSSWEGFEILFNASMENEADLSKETWLTVCGGTIGGYFWPVFAQYEIICETGENPFAGQPLMLPRAAEFDKRLLYQANVIFNFTDYTKEPVAFQIDGKTPPENSVTYNEFMCVVSFEYLSALNAGDKLSLTAIFDDGSEDTVEIRINDTTTEAYTPLFSDVDTDTKAWEFIHPLVQKGAIVHTGGEKFRPNDPVTYSELYDMLVRAGVPIEEPSASSAPISASAAEQLLFDALMLPAFEKEYKALNKQHLWLPNTFGDLGADQFAFLDMVGNTILTRAQAAEAVYRFIRLIDYAQELDAVQNPTVSPTSSEIFVDGKPVLFDAYNIGGNNYFKLRDLAYVLNGTAKQFGVAYDAGANRINLTSAQGYIPAGGEMSGKSNGPLKANMSQLYVSVDRRSWYWLTAYNIDGNNYFKLRDIANIIDFSVSYEEETGRVFIDTSAGYLE